MDLVLVVDLIVFVVIMLVVIIIIVILEVVGMETLIKTRKCGKSGKWYWKVAALSNGGKRRW